LPAFEILVDLYPRKNLISNGYWQLLTYMLSNILDSWFQHPVLLISFLVSLFWFERSTFSHGYLKIVEKSIE
jgi:hypothetical protein